MGPSFTTALWWGSLAFIAAAILSMAWPSRLRSGGVPVAGLLLAAAIVVALSDLGPLPESLIVGLVLLGAGGTISGLAIGPPGTTAVVGLAVSGVGAWSVVEDLRFDWAPGRPLAAALVVLAGVAVASADRQRADFAIGPILVAVSAVGLYLTVPETRQVLVIVAAALPVAVLGWPSPLAVLGRGGSFATVGVLAWVAVADGRTRPGAWIGALCCLGLLLIEPMARHLSGRDLVDRLAGHLSALVLVVLAHGVLVLFASRVVGALPSASGAALAAAAGFGLGLGALVAVARLPAGTWPLSGRREAGSKRCR